MPRPIKMSEKDFKKLSKPKQVLDSVSIDKKLNKIDKKLSEIITMLENLWSYYLKK